MNIQTSRMELMSSFPTPGIGFSMSYIQYELKVYNNKEDST